LYLMALRETLDRHRAAELACLSAEDAAAAREWVIDGGLIREDGNSDIESAMTWPTDCRTRPTRAGP
jgi:hypothetical protein